MRHFPGHPHYVILIGCAALLATVFASCHRIEYIRSDEVRPDPPSLYDGTHVFVVIGDIAKLDSPLRTVAWCQEASWGRVRAQRDVVAWFAESVASVIQAHRITIWCAAESTTLPSASPARATDPGTTIDRPASPSQPPQGADEAAEPGEPHAPATLPGPDEAEEEPPADADNG